MVPKPCSLIDYEILSPTPVDNHKRTFFDIMHRNKDQHCYRRCRTSIAIYIPNISQKRHYQNISQPTTQQHIRTAISKNENNCIHQKSELLTNIYTSAA